VPSGPPLNTPLPAICEHKAVGTTSLNNNADDTMTRYRNLRWFSGVDFQHVWRCSGVVSFVELTYCNHQLHYSRITSPAADTNISRNHGRPWRRKMTSSDTVDLYYRRWKTRLNSPQCCARYFL